jgi:hypothetical protein
MLAPDAERAWHYRSGDRQIALYVALYRGQEPGKEFAGFGSRLSGAAAVLDERVEHIGGAAVLASELEHVARRSLLWSYYVVDGKRFVRAVPAQLWYGWRTLVTLRSVDTVVWAANASCRPDCARAREDFILLVRDMDDM